MALENKHRSAVMAPLAPLVATGEMAEERGSNFL